MDISLDLLKKLREETSSGVMDCRQALEDAGGDYEKAKKLLIERGVKKAEKKANREVKAGIIDTYLHANGKVGVLLEIACETDFVQKTDDFKKLAHEVCLQIAAMNPKNVKELTKSAYIRDAGVTIETLIKQTIAKVGENISVVRFTRMQFGE